jgi:hypothetical protein
LVVDVTEVGWNGWLLAAVAYISVPATETDFRDDAKLRRFAHEVLTPMVERAS